jgi:D-serine dehydratase
MPVRARMTKGWPDGEVRTVADLPTPTLVLLASALERNIAAMAAWCARRGVLLAPHGKTTMAPALFSRQLAAGAWGITVATVQQAAVALDAGVRRILIANQLATGADCAWVAHALAARPDVRMPFLVDDLAGVELAARAAAAHAGPPLELLVEVGYAGGRCGVRDPDAAVALADAIAASDRLRLAGVEGYEGLIDAADGESAVERVDAFLARLATTAERIAPLVQVEHPLLSAGGSAYFDRVVTMLGPAASALGWPLVLRSGCYLTHDHGLYARLTPAGVREHDAPRFEPALELHASVLSVPEPGRAIVGLGRRDAGHDADLPVVLRIDPVDDRPAPQVDGVQVVALNDQHAFLDLPSGLPLRIGDTVVCGISHPCTTVERWRTIALADDDGRVLEATETRF